MPPKRLLDSTVFRVTLIQVGVYGLSAMALFYLIYNSTARYMDDQIRDSIQEEANELIQKYKQDGLDGLRQVITQLSSFEVDRQRIYLLVQSNGLIVTRNLPLEAVSLAKSYYVGAEQPDDYLRFDLPPESGSHGKQTPRPVLGRAYLFPDKTFLLVGHNIRSEQVTLSRLKRAITVGTLIILVLGVSSGYAVSRWMLGRLDRVNRLTETIMAGDLNRRLEISRSNDEFDELSRNLNRMLERIERLLAGMRQVSDDVAHDLRTPLTRLRARIEVALMHDVSGSEAHEVLEATLRDADRLIETFNALLSIARAEAGAQGADWERIDLSELAQDVFELYEPSAEEREIALSLKSDGAAEAYGHRQLIAQAIANLVDNGIKYAPAGGQVVLTVRSAPSPEIEVADNGPGIPPEEREHAKQRFVRLDSTRSTPGSGLGLSLVDAVATLHEAQLELSDNAPGLKAKLIFKPALAPAHVQKTLAAA